jgi:hypothetical protein
MKTKIIRSIKWYFRVGWELKSVRKSGLTFPRVLGYSHLLNEQEWVNATTGEIRMVCVKRK